MKSVRVRNPNKKQQRLKDQRARVRTVFNTGTRTHKSPRDYDRHREKLNLRNYTD